ncbi:hypothetical protein DFH28DRAFT_1119902 [Melampsora americana]|nr:hypothetical protein DFH28DRAFT_1119902 [Melampsora americana]
MSLSSELTSQPNTPEPFSDSMESFTIDSFELPTDFLNQLPPNLIQLNNPTPLPQFSIPVATYIAQSKNEFEQSSDHDCRSDPTEQDSIESSSDPNQKITLNFTLPIEMLKYLKEKEYLVVREIILRSGSKCELKLKTDEENQLEFLEFIIIGFKNQVSKAIEILTFQIWKWKKS